MVKQLFALGVALPLAAAWPTALEMSNTMHQKRTTIPTVPKPLFNSGRENTGAQGPALYFDAAEQYVDVTPGSAHEFQAPTASDLRGECPGLNAAANHGFLPRSGIANIQDTVEGLASAYNMAVDLSTILAVISIALIGDFVSETWSIGGSYKSSTPLLGQPTGILGSHNRYEGDASIIRGDAYLHGGDVGYFDMNKWEHYYSLGENGYTHDTNAAQNAFTTLYSVENNPYYFSAPFSGLVAPDAHNFVVNFMSNHSAAVPGGTLTREIVMSFFSVTGSPGSFVYTQGNERMPENWYRRPTANALTTAGTNLDTIVNNAMYPGIIRFGGNMGKVNSFAGVDISDLTGGLYNSASLLEGNNLDCFFLQATQAGLSDQLGPLLAPVGELTSFMDKHLGPFQSEFNCTQLSAFNNEFFQKYPGASYKAEEQ